MKICRFDDDRIGVVRGGLVHDVSAITEKLPTVRYPAPPGDGLIAQLDRLRDDAGPHALEPDAGHHAVLDRKHNQKKCVHNSSVPQ